MKRTFRGSLPFWILVNRLLVVFLQFLVNFSALIGHGSGGFLEITGAIGDFLVKVDEALKKGDRLHKFFEGLGDILGVPIELLGQLADLGDLFSGFSSGGFSGQMTGMTKAMTPFQRILEGI